MDTTKLVIGSTIQYVLPLSQRPTHPNKLWRGKITAISQEVVRVDSLEPGYEGQSEIVHLEHIKAIEEGIMT